MAIQDYFSDEERARQAALTRSWEAAQRDDANPEIRAEVEARLAELASRPPGPTMTGDEFLESVGFGPRASRAG